MLKVKRFTLEHSLSSSDGKLIKELRDEDFVALYDDKVYQEEKVNRYIHQYASAERDFPEDIVVLPLQTWTRLQEMIKNSYKLTPKGKGEKIL